MGIKSFEPGSRRQRERNDTPPEERHHPEHPTCHRNPHPSSETIPYDPNHFKQSRNYIWTDARMRVSLRALVPAELASTAAVVVAPSAECSHGVHPVRQVLGTERDSRSRWLSPQMAR